METLFGIETYRGGTYYSCGTLLSCATLIKRLCMRSTFQCLKLFLTFYKAVYGTWLLCKILWVCEIQSLQSSFLRSHDILTIKLTAMAPTGQPAPGSSLDETAAAPPPPGVVPNFINPENQASVINATLIICLSVATVFVWLRMYTRFLISKSHGYEDC